MFTYVELEEINRFLSTLETCEYMGVAPKFDEATVCDLRNIINAVRVEITFSTT